MHAPLHVADGARIDLEAPVEQSERSIAQWQELMESGAVSAVEIVEHYLARIDAIDRGGPALRRSSRSTPTPSRSPPSSTTSASGRARAARCTASRCCSRTTSTRATA